MYLSWAVFCEGASDRAYLNILLPKIMQEIILTEGLRSTTVPADAAVLLGANGREIENVAQEICDNRAAFHLVFIHSDTGGRGVERTLDSRSISYCRRANEICQFESQRCIVLTPKHEVEAWILSDPEAVAEAFGYRGPIERLELPSNAREAERLVDPKATLDNAYKIVVGRRRARSATQSMPAIARLQRLPLLRYSASFMAFESSLRLGLRSLGCIRADP